MKLIVVQSCRVYSHSGIKVCNYIHVYQTPKLKQSLHMYMYMYETFLQSSSLRVSMFGVHTSTEPDPWEGGLGSEVEWNEDRAGISTWNSDPILIAGSAYSYTQVQIPVILHNYM